MPIPASLSFDPDQGVTPESNSSGNSLIPDNLSDAPPAQPIHEFNQTTWGDYMNTLTSGVHGLGATGWSIASQATSSPQMQQYMLAQAQRQREETEDSLAKLSPPAQAAINAPITSSDFWQHPFRAVALQGVQQAPSLAAMAIPAMVTGGAGGVIGGALGETIGAMAGGAGAMSAVNAGQAISEFADWVNKTPDADLRKNDTYALLRGGMNEQDAKQRFIQMRLDQTGLAGKAAAIGAVAGAVGFPAQFGAGPVADTLTRKVLMGGLEGGISLGVQSGATEAAINTAQGKTPDAGSIFKHSLGAAATGAILSGFGGALRPAGTPSGSRVAPNAEAQPGRAVAVGSKRDYGKLGIGQNGGKARAPFTREQQTKTTTQPPSLVGDDQAAALAAAQPLSKVTPESKPAPEALLQPEVAQVKSVESPVVAPERPPLAAGMGQPSPATTIPEKVSTPVLPPSGPIPEGSDTLAEQHAALMDKNNPREAMIYSKGQEPLPITQNKGRFSQTTLNDGRVIQYDRYGPSKLSADKIHYADENDRLNELLHLGPVKQSGAVQREAAGETPVAVTERTPEGTEVKAAAGTEETAPAQVQALEQTKTPGNIVKPEPPAQVIADRLKARQAERTGRVLPDVSAEGKLAATAAEHQTIEAELKRKQAEEQAEAAKVSGGHHGSAKEDAKNAAMRLAADKIIQAHPAGPYSDLNATYGRAQAMVRAAKEAHVTIPSDFREGHPWNASMLKLREAADLIKTPFPQKPDFGRFMDRENLIDTGRWEEALAQRRAEGAAEMGAPEEGADVEAEGQLTPEEHLEEKQAKEETEGTAEPPRSYTAGTQRSGFQVTKKRTIGDQLKAQRAKINASPTGPQKEAGNYSKGHLFTGGHNISIETPKGGERSGVTPEGKKWSVEMPADYGYIRGTEGADGDHIDVMINPKLNRDILPSDRIFILNQRDPATGWFDEHKALMGFNNIDEAIEHYAQGFDESRGKTGRRIGGIVEMSNEDFKDWLKNGDKGQPVYDGPHGQQLNGHVLTVDSKGETTEFKPDGQYKLAHLLSLMGGLETREHFDFVAKKISELVPDVPVYIATMDDMKKLSPGSLGFYQSQFNHIILREDLPGDHIAHVVLHEAVHAATLYGLETNHALYFITQDLMNEVEGKEKPSWTQVEGKRPYGFINPYEFVAEAMSNRSFQERLRRTPISRELAASLGMNKWKQTTAWGGFINLIHKMFGLPEKSYSALEAAVAITERSMFAHDPYEQIRQRFARTIDPSEDRDFPKQYRIHAIREALDDPDAYSREYKRGIDRVVNKTMDFLGNSRADLGAKGTKFGIKIASGTQLLDMFGKHFQREGGNPMRTLVDARNKTGMSFLKYREAGQDLERESALLAKKYQGPDWDNYALLKNLSSSYRVHPDSEIGVGRNAYIPKASKRSNFEENLETWQARKHHPEVQELYRLLPPDLREFYGKERDFYVDRSREMAEGRLKAIFDNYDAPAGHTPESILALAKQGKLDDDIMEHYEQQGADKEILEAQRHTKEQGPYFPAAREGDYVVKGKYSVPAPNNSDTGYAGNKLPDNIREFQTRQAAHDFVSQMELPATTRIIYYDPVTKERTTKSNVQSVGGHNVSPDERYQVTVENNHLEMANSMSEARANRQAMIDAGVQEVSQVLDRRDRGTNNQITSAQTRSLIDRIQRRSDLTPLQKSIQVDAIKQTSLANQTGNRISKHLIARRNVAGADFETTQGLRDYNNASSAYLARVDTLPEIDQALEDMENITKEKEKDKNAFTINAVYNEMAARTQGFDVNAMAPKVAPVIQKLMTLNFLRYLASPAHILLHMMHPMLYTAPTLASKHGYPTAYRAMARAYTDIGGVFPTLGLGVRSGAHIVGAPWVRDMDKALDWARGANFLDTLTSKIVNTREKGLFNELSETGHIHPSNGFTADTYTGVGLDRANRFMREITGAAEAINRTASALAAYRLEYGRTLSHDQAVLYAKEVLEKSQGMFNAANSAPFTRIGWMRPFLQFRQFPMQIAYILGRNAYNIFKGETPEVKHQAMMALGGVLGTAGLLSGVGGMPTELLKVSAILGNALGVSYSPEEYQDQARRAIADEVGPTLTNVIFEGLPALAGPLAPSWAHRVGTGSLFTFGSPASGSADDLQAWVLSSIFGTPGALASDTLHGIQSAQAGDYADAVKYFAPAKIIADAARAYKEVEEGSVSKTGKETSPPLGVASGLMQLFGLMPEETVRAAEGRSALYQAKKRESGDKSAVIRQAIQGDHASALRAIYQWNQSHPNDMLTPSQIAAARRGATGKSEMGQKVTPKSKALLDEYQTTYGIP